MSRYSLESVKASAGVRISLSSASQDSIPAAIVTAHRTALEMQAVETAVFTFPYSFAPNSCETMTEQPILHPKANAMKINVTS